MVSVEQQIEKICSFPRKAGTDAERSAARYIFGQFQQYGYQPFLAEFAYQSQRAQELPDICELTLMQDAGWKPECFSVKFTANGTAEGAVTIFEKEETDCHGRLALIPWREDLQDLIFAACKKGAVGLLLYAETDDVEYDPIPWECIDRQLGIPMAGLSQDDAQKIIKSMGKGAVTASLHVEGAKWETTSENVCAIKHANCEDSEILIIGAHYDSFAGLPGANDDASGVAVLLEISRLLKDTKGDTEFHFIAFGADEEGMAGANEYADSLSEAQKKRVAGMIDLEKLGCGELYVGYPGDCRSWIGEALREALSEIQGGQASAQADDRGGHIPFFEDGMDAVMLCGEDEKILCKTARDRITTIDEEKLFASAQAVLSTALRVAEADQLTLNDPVNLLYRNQKLAIPDAEIQTDNLLFLGDDRYGMQKRLGITGLPCKEDPIPGTISYSIKWFGMEEAIDSLFHFDEGDRLCDVEILMQDAGVPFEDALHILRGSLGKPDDTYKEKSYEEYCWNGIYGNMHILEKEGDYYRVCIYEQYNEEKVLRQFSVKNGQISFSAKDAKYKKMWEMASSIMLPQYRSAITKFTVFTDGVSGKLAAVEFLDGKKTRYNLGLDYWDVYDEKGNIRDEKEFIETVAHEYGHIITISSEQVDLNETGQKDVFADIGTYREGSYLQAFYEAFYSGLEKDAEAMDYEEFYATYIEQFPTRYASYSPSEDLAECFAFFLMGETETIPPQKLGFLLKYPELVRARDFARESMGD